MVFLEALESHIRMLWGSQFVTPSFYQHTPEDGNVLAFLQDISLGLLPETVVVQMEWISSEELLVPRSTEMEALHYLCGS